MTAYWLHRQGFVVTVIERLPLARVLTSSHAVDLFGPAVDGSGRKPSSDHSKGCAAAGATNPR